MLAAQGIARRPVARTDAGGIEAAQRSAAQEEAVADLGIVGKTDDVPHLRGEGPRHILENGLVIGAAEGGAQKAHVAAKAGHCGAKPKDMPLSRVEALVAGIPAQGLTDTGLQVRALVVLDKRGGVDVDVFHLLLLQGVVPDLP